MAHPQIRLVFPWSEQTMNNRCLWLGFLAAFIVIGFLIGYGIIKYPLIVREAGISSILAPVFMFLLYGGIAIWATYQPSPARSHSLQRGTTVTTSLDVFWNDRYNINYQVKERYKESLARKLLTVNRLWVRLCGFFGARVTQQHPLKTWRKPCTWAGAVSIIHLATSGHYFWKRSSITVNE